ncbi:DUF2147 domain-containing protein [Pseudobdellovibrio exovorus]|uniref:DUF2147 domain-containing protein n=1 Tax=Pseudobdellovibrio exovorus JSS TaxID=1184267 RepID=M4V5M3_9BACT|nr:DUF2147 domain-containing protein [Pseudobdellovibrio exovorus]AGH94657.1 hypothetical protein A11Q_437 [Pseudobdellovibrio exovorus JSS]
MKAALMLVVMLLGTAIAQANPAVGRWKTIDDETKEPKSIVEITEVDGKLVGKIEKLFRKADEDQNPKCEKCTGDKKDQPIIGMQILEGLKKDADTRWSGGQILDPKNGKTYSCKLEVIEDGKKIKLRGFIGVSLLGRTQVWEREAAPEVQP